MKKVLLIVVAACFAIGTASAQSSFKSKMEKATGTTINFGPKFGFNFSSLSNGLDKSKFSFHAGGFAEFKFNQKYGFQAELLYSRMGDADKEGGVKQRLRVNYLQIPLLGKYYFCDRFSVEFGPQIGIALNAKSKTKGGGTEVKTDLDGLNTFDLGLDLGVAYDFDWGLVVNVRYNLGLTNVFDKDMWGEKHKNRAFHVSVGWRF